MFDIGHHVLLSLPTGLVAVVMSKPGADLLVHGADFVAGRIDRIAVRRNEVDIGKQHVAREVAALEQQARA